MATNTVFTPFTIDDIVTGVPNRVTNAMWSNGVGILTRMNTPAPSASTATNNNRYYIDVYGAGTSSGAATTGSSQVEFSIAYGHVSGSGSVITDRDLPTKAIYGQYRNLLLDGGRGRFALISSSSTYLNDFIAIDIKRANLKQKLDAGNWELHVSSSLLGETLTLIDNSGDASDLNPTNIGRVLSVVSGTIAAGAYSAYEYGLCYPDYGIIILSPGRISQSAAFTVVAFQYSQSINAYNDNHQQFYSAMSHSAYFAARSEEVISSTHYFVRAKNQYYNYSTNPSFYSASNGTVIYSDFATNPKVFITTIGLYNNNNELLAVGKLSQPVQKGFDKEALFKVRLDF